MQNRRPGIFLVLTAVFGAAFFRFLLGVDQEGKPKETQVSGYKTIFSFMVITIVCWQFLKIIYMIKSSFGIDLIPGWSLFH